MNELFFEDLSSFELVGTCMAEAKTAAIFSNDVSKFGFSSPPPSPGIRVIFRPGNIKPSPYLALKSIIQH